MNIVLSYSISVGIMLAVLYPIYKLALSKEGFHAYNRGILLTMYVLSLTYMPIYQALSKSNVADFGEHAVISQVEEPAIAGELTVSGNLQDTATSADIEGRSHVDELLTLILWVYSLGALLLLIHTLYMWIRVLTLIRSGDIHKYTDYNLVIVRGKNVAPFSWINYLVISEDDLDGDSEMILLHETTHIHCRHWIDDLISQLVILINWYNPVAWKLRKELRALHEYQADNSVINHGVDAAIYQMLLIKKATLIPYSPITTNFNQGKLKDRLNMMWNKNLNPRRKWRAAIMIPAIAIGAVVANSSLISEARTALISSAWDFQDEDAPGPEKVQRIFSMVPEKRDSAIVEMSDGTKKSVKIDNSVSSAPRTSKPQKEAKSKRSQKQSTSTTSESSDRTFVKISDWPNGGVMLPQGKDAEYFVDGEKVSKDECIEAIRKSPRRIAINNNCVEVQTTEDEFNKVIIKQAQEQARMAREQAKVAREQAQEQAKIAREQARLQREQAQEQARIQRELAQEQARIAREQAQLQREQSQEQARIQRELAQEQGKMAREEFERQQKEFKRQQKEFQRQQKEYQKQQKEFQRQQKEYQRQQKKNGKSFSISSSVSNGQETMVIEIDDNYTRSSQNATSKSALKKSIKNASAIDPNIFDGLDKRHITSVSIRGPKSDSTILVVAQSGDKKTTREAKYINGNLATCTTTTTNK